MVERAGPAVAAAPTAASRCSVAEGAQVASVAGIADR